MKTAKNGKETQVCFCLDTGMSSKLQWPS